MRDTVQIAFFVLSALALVCIVQLLLLILAHSDSCPKAAKVILPHLLLIPAAAFLFLIPAALLSKPSGFLDLRGLAAILFLIAALILLAGWGLGRLLYSLGRRKEEDTAKKQTRLYNVIFPIWVLMFWPSPPVILLTFFGNLAIDCLVLYLALRVLKHQARGAVLKRCWWKVWLLGFLSDILGALWLATGLFGAWALEPGSGWLNDFAMAMTVNPFMHPLALVWTVLGAAIAGVCIYFFDRRVFRRVPELEADQAHTLALAMAIATTPWMFFIPIYW